MEFIKTWLVGYYNPNKVIERLKDKPAPHWGFYASLLRAGFDSILLYLPLAILGRQPTTPSALRFLSTENYYWTTVFLMPVFLILLWLLLSGLTHLIFRLLHRQSNIDLILNITGMSTLIVGAILIPIDWLFIILNWHYPVALGFLHMIIALWGIVIIIIGYKKLLQVPVWLGVLLNTIGIVIAWALSAIFIRPPV